jgi:hypothetical protein
VRAPSRVVHSRLSHKHSPPITNGNVLSECSWRRIALQAVVVVTAVFGSMFVGALLRDMAASKVNLIRSRLASLCNLQLKYSTVCTV